MNTEQIRSLPKRNVDLKKVLQNAVIPEINIYNQSYLEIDTPLISTSIIHAKTQNEIGVEFNLEGQITGTVYCYLDTFNKIIDDKEKNFFQLLFVESMNILIGRMLTNIEENDHLISILSNPKFLNLKDQKEIQVQRGSMNHEVLSVGYKLIATMNEYDCRILFDLNK